MIPLDLHTEEAAEVRAASSIGAPCLADLPPNALRRRLELALPMLADNPAGAISILSAPVNPTDAVGVA